MGRRIAGPGQIVPKHCRLDEASQKRWYGAVSDKFRTARSRNSIRRLQRFQAGISTIVDIVRAHRLCASLRHRKLLKKCGARLRLNSSMSASLSSPSGADRVFPAAFYALVLSELERHCRRFLLRHTSSTIVRKSFSGFCPVATGQKPHVRVAHIDE